MNRQEKNGDAASDVSVLNFSSAVFSHAREAIAAVDRPVGFRLKGHSGLAAAVGADSGKVLPRPSRRVLSRVAAGLAALGLILEASFCVELLLAGGEHELVAALFAYQCLVFVHLSVPHFDNILALRAYMRSVFTDVA